MKVWLLSLFACVVTPEVAQDAANSGDAPEVASNDNARSATSSNETQQIHIVRAGQLSAGNLEGSTWQTGEDALRGGGVGTALYARHGIGAGDFEVRARFTVEDGAASAASLFFEGGNHFGLSGRPAEQGCFVEGPLFGGKTRFLGHRLKLEDELDLHVKRVGSRLKIQVNGETVFEESFTTEAVGVCGLRPWRATLAVREFRLRGRLHAGEFPETIEVFRSGEGGYHTYRIPAILRTASGSLLAFAEGRKHSSSDTGDIDLLVKRSEDGGRSWSAAELVWDDRENVCGNPCPVLDRETGTIWLAMTHNLGRDHESAIIRGKADATRTVWFCRSEDEGRSWSKPVDMTRQTKQDDWGWYATGPGIGIQLQAGPHRGRLLIPCDHSYRDPEGKVGGGGYSYGAHVIYSDDHGRSWQIGGRLGPKVNECQLAETSETPGGLLVNMRSYFGRGRRTQARSTDGGRQWSQPADVAELIEPVCQASLLRFGPTQDGRSRLLFSNPASDRRENMTVRLSDDEGRTWPVSRRIAPGPAAYSCLVRVSADEVGCLYEGGIAGAYTRIAFARFPLRWLEDAENRDAK